jgi:hypothetical protein
MKLTARKHPKPIPVDSRKVGPYLPYGEFTEAFYKGKLYCFLVSYGDFKKEMDNDCFKKIDITKMERIEL